jgi:hypothetical protein
MGPLAAAVTILPTTFANTNCMGIIIVMVLGIGVFPQILASIIHVLVK